MRRNRIRRKADVETHRLGYTCKSLPALNIKVRNFVQACDVEDEFPGVDSDVLEQAPRYCWDNAVERFWESAADFVREIFGEHVKCYSEGRSGGWMVVTGLYSDDIESWDAVDLAKWRKLANCIDAEIAWLSSKESMVDDIAANEYAKPGAERYNFICGKDGNPICIADMKSAAILAGFGPVVR